MRFDDRVIKFDSLKRKAHIPKSRVTKLFIGGSADEDNNPLKGSFLPFNVGGQNGGIISFRTLRSWKSADNFSRFKGIGTHSAPLYFDASQLFV